MPFRIELWKIYPILQKINRESLKIAWQFHRPWQPLFLDFVITI